MTVSLSDIIDKFGEFMHAFAMKVAALIYQR